MATSAELARNYTISDYLKDEASQNRDGIADAIHRRFDERYLVPISAAGTHGFTKLAVSCLIIEALESFRRGWLDTSKRGQGEYAFYSFFDAHEQFSPFRGHAREFYRGVRCGILHQAETAGAFAETPAHCLNKPAASERSMPPSLCAPFGMPLRVTAKS